MRRSLYAACLWGLIMLMTGCGGEDGYHYPSVKLEFVTVAAGEDGCIRMLVPDKGEALSVCEDRTQTVISSNAARRVLSNYEVLPEGARIYSLQSLITPEPKPADDQVYENGIKTDPVEMVSIWMGRDYLNMILNLKVGTGKGHTFGIVEDVSELETKGVVNLLLYHDADGDMESYNRRAYVSVPLAKYADAAGHGRAVKIRFKYYTYGSDGSAEESDKYCEPGFDYIPDQD